MQLLAKGVESDGPVVSGESAIAGIAGLIGAINDGRLAREMSLDHQSRILIFGTEGATDPELYEALVGVPAEAVLS